MPVRPQIEIREVEPGTREAFWREAIVAWAGSGLAQVEFCRLRGLELATFRHYRTRLTRPAKPAKRSRQALIPSRSLATCTAVPEFIEVQLPQVSSSGPASLEILLANGRRIAVRAGFEPETLRSAVEVLESC
jgi:hypothetical protein